METKLFSLDEANAELRLMNNEINHIQDIQRHFLNLYNKHKGLRNEDSFTQKMPHRLFLLEGKMEFMNILAKLHIKNIQSKGALLKDIQSGLIDFPAMLNNEFVYLSWKKGEKEIHYYHDAQDSYRRRKQLC